MRSGKSARRWPRVQSGADASDQVSGRSTLTSFVRLPAPDLMVTADLPQRNASAMRPMSSSLAFPSTGGDFNLATQVPSAASESSETFALGFTLT
jgi:hypothetical protein